MTNIQSVPIFFILVFLNDAYVKHRKFSAECRSVR